MNPADVLKLVASVFEWALAFVPHEDLKTALDDAARRRADAIADAAERAKFGTAADGS